MFNSFAQLTEYGVFGGLQTSTAKYTLRGHDQSTQNKFGFHLGAQARIPFENTLYFTPSLYYSLKGYKVTGLTDTSALPGIDVANDNVTIHTFEITPLFMLHLSSAPSHFFVQFGPSLDVAFAGTEKLTLKNGSTSSGSMPFDVQSYGRITAAAIIRFGYELANNTIIFASYEHGLASRNNYDFGPQIKDRIIGISVGKYFKRKADVVGRAFHERWR